MSAWEECASRYGSADDVASMVSDYTARYRARQIVKPVVLSTDFFLGSPPPPVHKPEQISIAQIEVAQYSKALEAIPANYRGFRLRRAVRLVCHMAKARTDCLMTEARGKDIVKARRMMSRLLARRGWSVSEIGRAMKRDHTSILNHLKPKVR
jgi:hypothetical protein